jgi:cytochrome c oxidase cbb3-type subunit 3
LNATGNAFVGAPNLTDDIWLYGGSKEALTTTITNGRNGIMPSFEKRLDDTQIRLLVAWLLRDQNGRLALKAADSVPSSR